MCKNLATTSDIAEVGLTFNVLTMFGPRNEPITFFLSLIIKVAIK